MVETATGHLSFYLVEWEAMQIGIHPQSRPQSVPISITHGCRLSHPNTTTTNRSNHPPTKSNQIVVSGWALSRLKKMNNGNTKSYVIKSARNNMNLRVLYYS